MYSLGCSSLLFAGHDRTITLQAMKEVGIGEIDLWSIPNWAEHVKLDADDPEEIANEVQGAGLQVCALSLYTSDPQRLRLGLEFAAKLGAPMVVNGTRGQSWDELAEFLRPALEVAERTGVKLALENHTDTLLDSSDRIEELCRRFPADLVGIAFAPPHCVVIGERPNDIVHRFADRILLLYLWDVSPRNRGLAWWRKHWHEFPEEQFPGSGIVDFQALADAIRITGYKGKLVICLHGTESWGVEKLKMHLKACREYLRHLNL